MKIAIITLSEQGYRLGRSLASGLDDTAVFVHTSVKGRMDATRFALIRELTKKIFRRFNGLVFIAPCGLVVRAIAPLVDHKTTDPAVVVVDVGGRYAISLLSGHEGGANTLAFRVANRIGAEPVISTTTEAVKDLIVGVGCRRGAAADAIADAVRRTLRKEGLWLERVRVLASAEIKADEPGLHAAARELGLPLRFVAGDEIRSTAKAFRHSPFVIKKVNLPAVAEPSALLAGRRTQLIRPRIILNGVTVAIARENCSSLASGRAARSTGRDGPNRPSRKAALLSATSITSKTSRT